MWSEYSILVQVTAFVFGAMVGSFANVCIYRLPLSLNIVTPRSHCTQCGTPITWFENIPVLSFLFLRGRCRSCHISIGWIHPLVETLIGFIAWFCVFHFGLTPLAFYYFVLITTLIIISKIDIDHQIIPDSISLGGLIIGLALALIFQLTGVEWQVTFLDALIGAAVGSGFLWIIAWIYEKLTGKEGLGFGDVKLMAMFGSLGGMEATFFSIFIGSLVGTFAGVFMIVFFKKGRRTPIPFGPFLCFGFIVYLLHTLHFIHVPLW
jgi:leader peptidase (prepilin peptidase)/N-methyltransferase